MNEHEDQQPELLLLDGIPVHEEEEEVAAPNAKEQHQDAAQEAARQREETELLQQEELEDKKYNLLYQKGDHQRKEAGLAREKADLLGPGAKSDRLKQEADRLYKEADRVQEEAALLQLQTGRLPHLGSKRLELPAGANTILQELAADEILKQILWTVRQDHPETKRPGNWTVTETKVLVELVSTFPSLCHKTYQVGNDKWQYPLVIVSACNPPLRVVETVYKAYPCPKVSSAALIFACAHRASLVVVIFLLRQRHETLIAPSEEGFLLQAACVEYKSSNGHQIWKPEVIQFLLKIFPKAANCRFELDGWLAVHILAWNNAPLSALQHVFEVNPGCFLAVNDYGNTALHCAMYAPDDAWELDLARFLVQAAPETIALENNDGLTPLDLSVIWDKSSGVVGLLLDHTNADDVRPDLLDSAVKWSSIGTVMVLLERFPFPPHQDAWGNNALHSLFAGDVPLDAYQKTYFLLLGSGHRQWGRDLLFQRNDDGETPFDAAKRAGADECVVELLLREMAWPGQLPEEGTTEGKKTVADNLLRLTW